MSRTQLFLKVMFDLTSFSSYRVFAGRYKFWASTSSFILQDTTLQIIM